MMSMLCAFTFLILCLARQLRLSTILMSHKTFTISLLAILVCHNNILSHHHPCAAQCAVSSLLTTRAQ